jgi:hypothetical protein
MKIDKILNYLAELLDLSDEEIAESSGHFGVGDMDHFVVDVEVNLGRGAEVLVGLIRLDVAHLVLKAEQNRLQIFRALEEIK